MSACAVWRRAGPTFGRDDVVLRVRAWPLELVNGHPIDRVEVTEEIEELRRDAAADLFARYSEASFPATSMPALDLGDAAYPVDVARESR